MTIRIDVVRVFTRADGHGGNLLGVVADGGDHRPQARQALATHLGFSETIFVLDGARVAIHTPTTELPFAGHPLVGAAWLTGLKALEPPAGRVPAVRKGDRAYISAPARFSPPWELHQLASGAQVDALAVPDHGHVLHWAWQDERRGAIRARVFAADYGVREDPATGSAALMLCASLDRAITVDQGAGSEILARPLDGGMVQLGGRVVAVETRWE